MRREREERLELLLRQMVEDKRRWARIFHTTKGPGKHRAVTADMGLQPRRAHPEELTDEYKTLTGQHRITFDVKLNGVPLQSWLEAQHPQTLGRYEAVEALAKHYGYAPEAIRRELWRQRHRRQEAGYEEDYDLPQGR